MNFKKALTGISLSVAMILGLIVTPIDANAANTANASVISNSTSSAIVLGTDVVYSASFSTIPSSDDGKAYLYELKTYEYSIPAGAAPIAVCDLTKDISLRFPHNYVQGQVGRIYNKFVLAVMKNGVLSLVTDAQYINNPEMLATEIKVRKARPAKALQGGNVANITLSGSGTALPIGATHAVFQNDNRDSITVDATVNSADAHPVKNNPVVAYMLNANDDVGIAGLVADMTAYAKNTPVQDFVIGNEVNERCWNYMAWTDWDTYVRKYVQAFRVCYTAIKAVNPTAMVYISLDQVWDKNPSGSNYYEYLDGDQFLAKFNTMIVQNGNIDWNMSIHPYPNPLYYAKFWDLSGLANGATYKAQVDKNQVITFQNLSVLTNVLTQPAYLNRVGGVRDVIIGEIGLGSNAGVDAQAAAICASYAAFERNPYVSQYLYLEVDVNGFYPTLTGKALEAYNAMGTANEAIYMEWAKSYIGITDWSQVLR